MSLIYYSEEEYTDVKIGGTVLTSVEWKERYNGKEAEEITDWSKIKTYLVDFGTYEYANNERNAYGFVILIE